MQYQLSNSFQFSCQFSLKNIQSPYFECPQSFELSKNQYEQWIGIWSGDIAYSYASQFVLGYTYNVNWYNNWLGLSILASQHMNSQESGIVFRFNYTVQRKTFDVYRNRNHKFLSNLSQVLRFQIHILATMVTGTMIYLHHSSMFVFQANKEYNRNQQLFMVYSAKKLILHILMMYRKSVKEMADVSIWPNGRLQISGENVTIQYEYINFYIDSDVCFWIHQENKKIFQFQWIILFVSCKGWFLIRWTIKIQLQFIQYILFWKKANQDFFTFYNEGKIIADNTINLRFKFQISKHTKKQLQIQKIQLSHPFKQLKIRMRCINIKME
ncbi:unnamed protein product [Paramecium sonneborni]|uniref:Uncharacterized protein n=1 Tax=Paramecium sonneborni TaxID=65129 RepID=A0A8S1QPV9_9CILI|nr:unnamed protein product [Paramecium sonneborni]